MHVNRAAESLPEDDELAARLRLSTSRLVRRLRQLAAAELSLSQLSALATLARSGPLSLGRLAACERIQAPTASRIVDSLERAGLVSRERADLARSGAEGIDRRVVRVRISGKGERLLARNRGKADAFLRERLAALAPGERALLARAAALLERLLEEEGA